MFAPSGQISSRKLVLRRSLVKESLEIEFMKSKSSLKPKRVMMLVIMLGVFINVVGIRTLKPLIEAINYDAPPQETELPSEPNSGLLRSQEAGYEIVLEREPENRSALEGLVEVRIELNEMQGALEALDKLIELDPDNSNYQKQRATIQNQSTHSEADVNDGVSQGL